MKLVQPVLGFWRFVIDILVFSALKVAAEKYIPLVMLGAKAPQVFDEDQRWYGFGGGNVKLVSIVGGTLCCFGACGPAVSCLQQNATVNSKRMQKKGLCFEECLPEHY